MQPGTKLGPYEVVVPLGAGGMGEVYRARDSRLGRDVALKVLPAAVGGDPDRLARLQREAQVGALRALQQEAAAQAALPAAEGETNPAFAGRPRPASAVICGDFNCEPGSPAHVLMQRALAEGVPAWRDAWQLLHPGRPHPPSVGLHGAEWPDRAYCCDFFFVTEDLAPRLRRVEVLADTAASDHQPVVLELAD